MLSNEDLAELLESTRDRVKLMGGDAPSAVGVVVALNGLITMLRDEVVEDAAAPDEETDYAASSPYAEPEPEPEPERELEPEPAPQRRIPNRLRRQQEEQTKPANPLLSDQYAGFFNKLIADQKPQPRESDEEEPEPEQQQQPPPTRREEPPARAEGRPPRAAPAASSSPPVNSSVAPQYRGFFDALVRDQKGEAAAAPAHENLDDEDESDASSGNGDSFTPPTPPPEEPPRAPGVWRDETSTG